MEATKESCNSLIDCQNAQDRDKQEDLLGHASEKCFVWTKLTSSEDSSVFPLFLCSIISARFQMHELEYFVRGQ